MEYHRLSDEEYAKAIGQARGQLRGIFKGFNKHGMDTLIPGAIEAIMEVMESFGKRVRGKDVPIEHTKSLPNLWD